MPVCIRHTTSMTSWRRWNEVTRGRLGGSFFLERLQSVSAHAPLGGVTGGGWELTYNDEPNQMIAASQAIPGPVDYTSSIGLLVKLVGTVHDAIPGMLAYQRGIRPYTRMVDIEWLPILNRRVQQSSCRIEEAGRANRAAGIKRRGLLKAMKLTITVGAVIHI